MQVYLVGGAVRDKLLGLPVRERDWVVIGATPEELRAQGYRPVGKDFPVFLHPETKEEYALARTERKTAPGYKGFEFHASPEVTLEEDLRRRDLTINAMAADADGTLIDPYHGEDDLYAGLLRHVSPAFAEDPVRILRVARFAAQFGKWGFKVAHATNGLMRSMVANGEVDHLVPERVWSEFARALTTDTPEKFFTVLRGCDALGVLFPEIDREFAQPTGAHGGGELPGPLRALQQSALRSNDPRIRFAVLMLALGRDLSQQQRLDQVQSLCQRLRAPNEYSEVAADAVRLEQQVTSDDPEQLLNMMETSGAFRQTGRWTLLLKAYGVAGLIDGAREEQLGELGRRAAAVNAAQLAEQQLSGPALGAAIRERRLAVLQDAG
ncbi:MAG: multifunctional CCA tRNA nucleotidyl transferase/2'3'-cyclic phosphodiesterase/2'nucleotidase/phosphatase [Thiogranum sp.]|nr:multifunctional CCA tRNA nucleotidyl transferase/2'3'-cyclic phosphodiesterase/2'nucleotidase/phosphatase [Thiogranum sp.]